MFLGIEIGGSKLQLGVGADDGVLRALWRGTVDLASGPSGIRRQIESAIPTLLAQAGLTRADLEGVGVGFGGPVNLASQAVIKSHQVPEWEGFPLARWVAEAIGVRAVLGNDADVAGLAEAQHGAGKGFSPIFYVTVGSGIGGGLIVEGKIFQGAGRGAAEIGHLRIPVGEGRLPLEQIASGWGIQTQARERMRKGEPAPLLRQLAGTRPLSTALIAEAAQQGDALAREVLADAWFALAEALCHVIALLCPRRIVIGGGVSLLGEGLFFAPLRERVAEHVFAPFAGLTDIVPAALGEEVVVHGAIALARQTFASP